jgi:hypothetical protein
MTMRRLSILQWVGLALGGVVWFAGHVVGFAITQAECGAGGRGWGISPDTWQASLTATAAALVVAAQAAAVAVLAGTRGTSYESEPPPGRVRFLAIAALAANLIFLAVVLLDGVGSLYNTPCRQA